MIQFSATETAQLSYKYKSDITKYFSHTDFSSILHLTTGNVSSCLPAIFFHPSFGLHLRASWSLQLWMTGWWWEFLRSWDGVGKTYQALTTRKPMPLPMMINILFRGNERVHKVNVAQPAFEAWTRVEVTNINHFDLVINQSILT